MYDSGTTAVAITAVSMFILHNWTCGVYEIKHINVSRLKYKCGGTI